MDEILANLLEPWIALFNQRYNKNLTIDEMKEWGVEHFVGKGLIGPMYRLLDTPNLFKNLVPLPGGKETLKRIHDKGHEVIISTSQAKLPQISADKLTWLRNHLPWLDHENVFIGRKKYKLKGDVWIDDGPRNHKLIREHWPDVHICSISYPYNRETKGLVNLDAEGYKDTSKAWSQIEAYIDKVANE